MVEPVFIGEFVDLPRDEVEADIDLGRISPIELPVWG